MACLKFGCLTTPAREFAFVVCMALRFSISMARLIAPQLT